MRGGALGRGLLAEKQDGFMTFYLGFVSFVRQKG